MDQPRIIRASQVRPREIEWLWYPFIPYGKVTILQGDAGDGKSTFILKLAAMLSRGEPMPFTDAPGQGPINIIYQSSEDDADDTIVPRYLKAQGDPDRLLFIDESKQFLSFSDPRLLAAARETRARLIVLDPLSAYIETTTGLNNANEVRGQMRPLIELARELRCAVVIVHHMNKASGQKALHRGVGSVDVIASARSALVIARTGSERPDERIMAQVKSNLAPTGSAILFSIGGCCIDWLSAVDRTADEVLGYAAPIIGRPDTQMQQATQMLRQLLISGPMPVSEIERRTKAAGISMSTVKKAKPVLGIQSVKQGASWLWVLPPDKPLSPP